MSVRRSFLLVSLCVSFCFLFLFLSAKKQKRTWRTNRGEELRAVWDISADNGGDEIRLVKDGKGFRVRLDKLTVDDQNYIWSRRTATGDSNAEFVSDFVPEDEDGTNESENTNNPKDRIPSVGRGSQAGDKKTLSIKGVDYTFRWCPPGEFMMGSPESEEGHDFDEFRHRVTIRRGFWLLESEVTQEMWESVMGNNVLDLCNKAGCYVCDDPEPTFPIYYVSWDDAKEFCKRLSLLTEDRITLPTEAQWEYACRAGTTGPFGGTGVSDNMGWFDDDLHQVKEKEPNAWGFYDMHGNLWEWCSDWYAFELFSETDPAGPDSGQKRVCRGGSYDSYSDPYLAGRSASRNADFSTERDRLTGFRIALIPSTDTVAVPDKEQESADLFEEDASPQSVSEDAESPSEPRAIPDSEQVVPPGPGSSAGKKVTIAIRGVDYTFRWCPPGEFMMGSPESEEWHHDDEFQHRVVISRGFWMLETELTQQMWNSVMGTEITDYVKEMYPDPDFFPIGPHYPIRGITWKEADRFCKELSSLSGLTIRLPTEAQWEYACRAGTTGRYAIKGRPEKIAWLLPFDPRVPRGGAITHPCEVKSKKPNAWGLYDMHGNVWEYCSDAYDSDYYKNSPTVDPKGPDIDLSLLTRKRDSRFNDSWDDVDPDRLIPRVMRGGSWNTYWGFCSSAARSYSEQGFLSSFGFEESEVGFRPVLIPRSGE